MISRRGRNGSYRPRPPDPTPPRDPAGTSLGFFGSSTGAMRLPRGPPPASLPPAPHASTAPLRRRRGHGLIPAPATAALGLERRVWLSSPSAAGPNWRSGFGGIVAAQW